MDSETPAPINIQPFYLRHRQNWAVSQERQRHTQALFTVGEPALFSLMWHVEDHEAGLVDWCSRCRQDPTTILGRVEAAYRQPLTSTCPQCYGTTFEGGFRAQVVRPAIFGDIDEDERKSARGVVHPEGTSLETTNDIRIRTGDYVFRGDGSRWQLGTPSRVQVRTGYEHPTQVATSIGYARVPVNREDESSVAYDLPPSLALLGDILATAALTFPAVNIYDDVLSPLIPIDEAE